MKRTVDLVKDGGGNGQGTAGVGNIHYPRHAAFTRAAAEQQNDLQQRMLLL